MNNHTGRLVVVGEVLAIFVSFVVANLAILVFSPQNPLRVLISLFVLVVLPGYAILTLVFPARKRHDGENPSAASLGNATRLALSFALSLALAPLFGYLLFMSGAQLTFQPVFLTVTGVTAFFAVLGAIRRLMLPPTDRYVIPLGASAKRYRSWVSGQTRPDMILNVALTLVIVTAVSGLALGIGLPERADSYTEVALLQETDNGTLVAADYDTQLARDESAEYIIEITNQEGETVSYSVVVQQQTLVKESSGDLQVVTVRDVDRFQREVENDQTWRFSHQFSPRGGGGEQTRLVYLVYRGSPPENPSTDSAYRYVTVWYELEEV